MNSIACDHEEAFLVTADGSTLLVYTGDDEQPLWTAASAAALIGLGVTDEEVISLDEAGSVVWWDGERGERSDEVKVKGTPRMLAVDADGVAAVLTDTELQLLDPGDEPRTVAVSGARAVAWSASGEQVAVGGRDGTLRFFDEAELEPIASVALPGAITAVIGLVDGAWLVAVGANLHLVNADGRTAELLLEVPEHGGTRPKPDCLAASADGALVACRVAPGRVLAFDRETRRSVASVTYADRTVAGVAFGAKSWLCVGLDGGDANRISLRTGAVRPTSAHPGRTARPATPEVEVSKLERRARPIRPVSQGAAKPRRPQVARTEAEIRIPDAQTLGMLGVVALSTLLMWGAAKFACNAHPPESKKPREVGTVELASTPKDAAIEIVQRLASYEFDRALELADTAPAQEIEKQLRACEAGGKDACDAKREKAAGKVLTTAELLTRTGNAAKARVTTTGPDGTRVYAVDLVNSPPIWKVTRLAVESG